MKHAREASGTLKRMLRDCLAGIDSPGFQSRRIPDEYVDKVQQLDSSKYITIVRSYPSSREFYFVCPSHEPQLRKLEKLVDEIHQARRQLRAAKLCARIMLWGDNESVEKERRIREDFSDALGDVALRCLNIGLQIASLAQFFADLQKIERMNAVKPSREVLGYEARAALSRAQIDKPSIGLTRQKKNAADELGITLSQFYERLKW